MHMMINISDGKSWIKIDLSWGNFVAILTLVCQSSGLWKIIHGNNMQPEYINFRWQYGWKKKKTGFEFGSSIQFGMGSPNVNWKLTLMIKFPMCSEIFSKHTSFVSSQHDRRGFYNLQQEKHMHQSKNISPIFHRKYNF